MATTSPLRQRMIEDMTIRNLSQATQQRPSCGVICLTYAAELSLRIMRAPPHRELVDEAAKPHQVHDPKERALLSVGDVWIRGGCVGPLRRNRANRAVIDAQQ